MPIFQDISERRKRSVIRAFSICMTVLLKELLSKLKKFKVQTILVAEYKKRK